VKSLSKVIAVRPILTGVAVLLLCALVAAALWSRHPAIISALAPRQESQTRELDETIGATVEPLDPPTARSLGLMAETRGLVVTSVASGGPAARAGIRTGDVVVAVDRPVRSINDLAAGLGKNDHVLTVTLKRHSQSVIVPLMMRSDSAARSLV
jgi:serine protease Do